MRILIREEGRRKWTDLETEWNQYLPKNKKLNTVIEESRKISNITMNLIFSVKPVFSIMFSTGLLDYGKLFTLEFRIWR